jgi:hypothetical protein
MLIPWKICLLRHGHKIQQVNNMYLEHNNVRRWKQSFFLVRRNSVAPAKTVGTWRDFYMLA